VAQARRSTERAPAAEPEVDHEFLVALCHQVRTPLHGILGNLELLLDSSLPAETRELARAAYDSARVLHEVFEQSVAPAKG
jgi:signal transduction histidine kinase